MKVQNKTENTILDVAKAFNTLRWFVNVNQLTVMDNGTLGEERQYFIDKFCEYADRIDNMPKTYEQDGKGDQAIVYLHYFRSGMDWYITERDMEDEQYQAFGLADLGDGGELGYISIQELIENGVELDLHWTPKTLAEVKQG